MNILMAHHKNCGGGLSIYISIIYLFTIPQLALLTAFSESGHPFVSYADIFPIREITLYTREAIFSAVGGL